MAPFIKMPSDFFQLFLLLGVNFLNSYLSVKVIVSHLTFPVFFSFCDSRSFVRKKKTHLSTLLRYVFSLEIIIRVFWGFLVEEKTDELY